MVFFTKIIDFVLHIDKYLDVILQHYGPYIYIILFLIIFAETGLVIIPFLPGDSLLFIAGAFAANGSMDVLLLFLSLSLAAIVGDSFNYYVGKKIGGRVANSRWIKREYIEKTQNFYDKHGGKTIVLARFIPIVRTFAPFVAGIGKMNYTKFLGFNVFGGIIWVGLFVFGGYYFGSMEIIQNNLSLFLLLIIFLSIVPVVIELFRNKKSKQE